jgi:hypothetical protein
VTGEQKDRATLRMNITTLRLESVMKAEDWAKPSTL